MKLELWYPTKYPVVQKFGRANTYPPMLEVYEKLGLLGHNGWDFSCPTGTKIRAAHDGIVTFTGLDGGGGETLVLRTLQKYEYGNTETYFKTIYVHNLPGSYRVKPGDVVKTGDVLVLSDNTGISTGPHLHFGLKPIYQGEQDWEWWNWEQNNGYRGAIDPEPYWTGYAAEDATLVRGVYNTLVDVLGKLVEKLKNKK